MRDQGVTVRGFVTLGVRRVKARAVRFDNSRLPHAFPLSPCAKGPARGVIAVLHAISLTAAHWTITPSDRLLASRQGVSHSSGGLEPEGARDAGQHALQRPGRCTRTGRREHVAMYDAPVAAWHIKFNYWTLRPVNPVRERYDQQFLPYLITPAFPAYVAGHAIVSSAASEVLAHFFPEDAGVLRAMAQDAADSRLYGGIHLRSNDEEGLQLGRRVGRRVVEHIQTSARARLIQP